MIEKTVTIDGRDWTFRSSALLPKKYREKTGRDLVVDMRKLREGYKDGMDTEALEILERVAWVMLGYAGEDVGDDPDEWLENLDGAFSAYEALPAIFELWNTNNRTTSIPRKK